MFHKNICWESRVWGRIQYSTYVGNLGYGDVSNTVHMLGISGMGTYPIQYICWESRVWGRIQYSTMNVSKRKLKFAIIKCKKEREINVASNIAETRCHKSSRNFWSEIKHCVNN